MQTGSRWRKAPFFVFLCRQRHFLSPKIPPQKWAPVIKKLKKTVFVSDAGRLTTVVSWQFYPTTVELPAVVVTKTRPWGMPTWVQTRVWRMSWSRHAYQISCTFLGKPPVHDHSYHCGKFRKTEQGFVHSNESINAFCELHRVDWSPSLRESKRVELRVTNLFFECQ